MKAIKLTKDNYLAYVDTTSAFSVHTDIAKLFPKAVKSLCQVAPEFTHDPYLTIRPMAGPDTYFYCPDGFAKLLVYESAYFYDKKGSCVFRFCDSWFGLDGNKFGDADKLEIDFESFGIKKATEARIIKIYGE